jgi:hypothetical protein
MFPLSLPNKPFYACAKLTQSFAKKNFKKEMTAWSFAQSVVLGLYLKK